MNLNYKGPDKRLSLGRVLYLGWKEVISMPLYTVHFMTPFCSYEGIEAGSEDDAIAQCFIPAEFDANEPCVFVAIEEEEEE